MKSTFEHLRRDNTFSVQEQSKLDVAVMSESCDFDVRLSKEIEHNKNE